MPESKRNRIIKRGIKLYGPGRKTRISKEDWDKLPNEEKNGRRVKSRENKVNESIGQSENPPRSEAQKDRFELQRMRRAAKAGAIRARIGGNKREN